jgi:prepilin-type N-terminal cleavage/methylation domain-containing protein
MMLGKIRQHGFTVLELLMVLVIASVLMGIAVPSFQSWLPTLRLSNAARQVATDLQLARMRAISSNADKEVTFNAGSGTYSFGAESRDLDELFPGITITSASNPTFTPRGTVNSVTITLSNGSAQKQVCVKVMGRINVQNSTC